MEAGGTSMKFNKLEFPDTNQALSNYPRSSHTTQQLPNERHATLLVDAIFAIESRQNSLYVALLLSIIGFAITYPNLIATLIVVNAAVGFGLAKAIKKHRLDGLIFKELGEVSRWIPADKRWWRFTLFITMLPMVGFLRESKALKRLKSQLKPYGVEISTLSSAQDDAMAQIRRWERLRQKVSKREQ